MPTVYEQVYSKVGGQTSRHNMPAVEGLHPEIKDNRDGSISVEYLPTKGGRHEVQMCYEGVAVEGSPFQCLVDSVDDGYVSVFGPGLVGGMCGQMESFNVVTKSGTLKDLVVTIDGPTKTELKREDKGDRTTISYMPMTSGAYNISIKYKGKPIKGSPFIAKISAGLYDDSNGGIRRPGEGRKRTQLSISNCSDYPLNVLEPEIFDLAGSLKNPSGAIEPCILKKMPDGHLGIAAFAPREKGEYQVQIYRDEKPIKGSPFSIKVGEHEIAHAAKVNISGKISDAIANEANYFTIDANGAGYGAVGVVLEGPHRAELDYTEPTPRQYQIMYSPHEPGIYILNVRFADEHVNGSPFLVNVGGEPSGRIRETVTVDMDQAEPVNPGTRCEFHLKIPGTNPFDMEASVTDPDGATEVCEVVDEEDFHYRIVFTPKLKGVNTLSIKHKGLHISGSPFQYTVGQMNSGGFHKVQVGGPGVEKGEAGAENHFNIYTREAGSGTLSIAVEGPSKAHVKVESRPHGFLGVSYKVQKPGMYGVHIKFNDEHIPNSPFKINISPDGGTAKLVTVHALKDRGLATDKPATFTISFNGAVGQLHATVRTPSGNHEDCLFQEMDVGLYACRFIPKENGVHYIDVRLNEAHVPDSPFAVMVGSTAADPAMVHALGEGLESGKCNSKNRFMVRTAGSGSGFLAVFVDGPSKVALSCKEVDDGYEFSYTPFAPGKYLITIKYGNINIAGSPYCPTVTGAGRKPSPLNEQTSMVVETVEKKAGSRVIARFRGDASKVVVRGPGLKKCFTNRQAQVTIDVKDAGEALLGVGMIGPNGMPEAELSLKRNTNFSYNLFYTVKEPGDHLLYVKWGDEDVPGSPFPIST